jgi:hypothetical protein
LAKALIMLVRLLSLAGLILGAFLWSEHQQLLGPHIGAGFLLAIVVFAMSIFALIKKIIVPGILGVVLAFAMPVVGFMQLPLTFHTMRTIQALHIALALAIIGVAESIYSAIHKTR